jgi:hypothetical protein
VKESEEGRRPEITIAQSNKSAGNQLRRKEREIKIQEEQKKRKIFMIFP